MAIGAFRDYAHAPKKLNFTRDSKMAYMKIYVTNSEKKN
jgi:hypothetical protein